MRKLPMTVSSAGRGRLVLAAALGLSSMQLPMAVAEVPDLIHSKAPDREAPIWVSADLAVRDQGINRELFSPDEGNSVQQALDADQAYRRETDRPIAKTSSETDCALWTTTTIDWEEPLPNQSLPALVGNAKAVLAGTISDQQQGFYLGQAGTLYEVTVDRALKYPGPTVPPTILVFYQLAKIRVGESMLCAKAERDENAVPGPGARVVIFAYRSRGGGTDVIVPDEEEFFFETADRRLSIPPGVNDLPETLEFEALLRAVGRLSNKED